MQISEFKHVARSLTQIPKRENVFLSRKSEKLF